jgi:hypothetical protein
MKIRILRDFRGRETNEVYYQAGDTTEVAEDIAARLIEINVAAPIEEKSEDEKHQSEPDNRSRRKRNGNKP